LVCYTIGCGSFEAFLPYKQKPVPAVVQVIKGFSAKSDGKDKLTALVQVRWPKGVNKVICDCKCLRLFQHKCSAAATSQVTW
jgi:hypothetical protein